MSSSTGPTPSTWRRSLGGGRARRNRHADLSRGVRTYGESDLRDLLADEEDPLVLLLDQVQDPHNLGAILRTADAAGVCLVVAPRDRSSPITDTVRKVACGGAENVPFASVTNLVRSMEILKEEGVWMAGTADRAEASLYETDLTGPLGIVMGSEGRGARRLTLEHCDFLMSIPMSGSVECLNVSVATGVCLFEAVRQRQSR